MPVLTEADKIVKAVLDHYLSTGDGLTAGDIARKFKWSHGRVPELLSGDYRLRTVAHATFSVWTEEYIPTRSYLRYVILALLERQNHAERMGVN